VSRHLLFAWVEEAQLAQREQPSRHQGSPGVVEAAAEVEGQPLLQRQAGSVPPVALSMAAKKARCGSMAVRMELRRADYNRSTTMRKPMSLWEQSAA
jgi:hypothetical protein